MNWQRVVDPLSCGCDKGLRLWLTHMSRCIAAGESSRIIWVYARIEERGNGDAHSFGNDGCASGGL